MWRKFMLPIYKQKRLERLLRLRAGDVDGSGTDAAPQDKDSAEGERTLSRVDFAQERALVKDVLSTLELDSLKMLCEVIESRGHSLGSCVIVPKNEYVLRSKSATNVVLFCRYYRWPEVDCQVRLRRLFMCQGAGDDCHDCINPYHWSRIYTGVSESLPPPVSGTKLSSLPAQRRLSGESETAPAASETTGGTSLSCQGSEGHWCTLMYWEHQRLVGPRDGRLRAPLQHVYYGLPHQTGIELEDVCSQSPPPAQDVLRTRAQIGAGLSLSLEQSGVWLYNRSQKPLFVSSPTLDPPDGCSASAVHKLSPGFSALVFTWSEEQGRRRRADAQNGPRDPYTVTVSFAKGWGDGYKRQTALQCPCRLELCFLSLVDRWR